MKMRRMISAVLVVMLLLSVLPGVAFGITTNDIDTKGTTTGPYDDSELYLGKTATLEDDGSYTIRLEAFATGNPVTTQLRSGLPLDIVLVLDQSGSMFSNNYLETLRESVDEFIDVIAANGRTIGVTHRVGIVGFASDEDDGSSGNDDNTDHELAGGNDEYYVNTGVFLEDGSFKNYGAAQTTSNYVPFDGEPVPTGTYFVRIGNYYRQLTASTNYELVSNPAIDRTDLYARVSNTYYPAVYADNAYYAVTELDTNETYYVDIDGVKTAITARVTTNVDYDQVNTITNADGQVYYIDTDTSADGENWIAVTCKASGSWLNRTYTWTGSDGKTYTRSNNGTYFTQSGSSTRYDPHTRSETTTVTWTTADGTVVNLENVTVYECLSGWIYEQNGTRHVYTGDLYRANGTAWTYSGTTYDPETTQFLVREVVGGLTNDDYRDALMPVTDGEAGAGRVTEALNIAVSKIAASGATRISLGMELAKNILDNRSSLGDEDKRQTVVIVFTDGTPGYAGFEDKEANAAMNISAQLKAEDGYNATVYTIGLYAGEPVSSPVSVFMHGLSSNYPTATQMTDVATITYSTVSSTATTIRNEESLTSEWKLLENFVYRTNGHESGTYYYLPMRGRIYNGSVQLQQYSTSSGSWTTISSNSYGNIYRRTTDTYDTTGKHYMHTDDKEELYNIFPEIITDSTTTTLDQKWLTADTLIRDIMESGFVFANGTTVTMSTLAGTSSDHMITWADAETVIDSVTVTDATQSVVTSEKGWLSVHNEGGYAFVEATGFDFNEYFFGTSNPESGEGVAHEEGAKLIITIEGVEATDNVTWNQTELTNNPYSGVWSPVLGDGTRAQIGVFPQPNTFFTDSVVVLDYAKTTADLAAQLRQDGVKHLDADGMNRFTEAALVLEDTYGDVTAKDGQLTYKPTTMKWDGYDAFYVFGNTDDAEVIRHSANKVHNNLWSKVTVIPANNVYYEDTFVEANGANVGIEYTGAWTQGSLGSNVENPEDDVQGWEDSLADDNRYSDGSAAVGGLDEEGNAATATFTFTGTGVDIYSRTNMQTGMIMAAIYAGEQTEGMALRTLIVDNFAHSGDYYMIPTLSIHSAAKRGDDGKVQFDEDGNVIYAPLPYGTYTVKLTVLSVTNDADFDGTDTTRSTYYLDGIRVYNPLGSDIDHVVKEAYGDDELNAAFAEVRDILLDANSFDKSSDKAGAVFIDQLLKKDENDNYIEDVEPDDTDPSGSTSDIGVYEAIGPENEVYLAQNQMIAFAPAEGENYYVGLKSPTGEPVDVMITGADGNLESFTIDHTTDLFYEIGTNENGIAVITNLSKDILSITKIKATHPDPEMQTFAMFRSVRREEVLEAADAVYAAANAPEEPEMPDIEIENPETQEPENKPGYDDLLDLVVRIIGSLWDWFH